jgi:hypothetical protein
MLAGDLVPKQYVSIMGCVPCRSIVYETKWEIQVSSCRPKNARIYDLLNLHATGTWVTSIIVRSGDWRETIDLEHTGKGKQ